MEFRICRSRRGVGEAAITPSHDCWSGGVKDDTYPVMLLNPMVERLRAMGYQIEMREKNMDHNLNGNIGPACKVEERWMKQYIEALYQDSSLGALM